MELVDVFYYDYILYKIISLYLAKAPSDKIAVYCKLANIFNIECVDARMKLDPEVYFKIIFIKVVQLCSKEDTSAKRHIHSIMAYLMHVLDVHRLSDLPQYGRLVRIISICYTYHFSDDPQADAGYLDFILKSNGTTCHRKMLATENLPENFNREALFDCCKTFKFGRPILLDFVHQIKRDIDRNMSEKNSKKPKVDVNTTSPGQKINWD